MLITILATVVVLGVLIFVHELGHFVTAKLVDIEVPRFSIGLGPKLWGFRRGETEYVISWLPLGGYVKMAGMEEMERIEGDRAEREAAVVADAGLVSEVPRAAGPRDFESKSLSARTLVISAGVLMNVVFAFAVFSASALVWGVEREREARIADVVENRLPAGSEALAAAPQGSRVVEVGGREVANWSDLRGALLLVKPGPVEVRFESAPPITIEVPANDSLRAELVGALQPELPPLVGSVLPDSPAERAGLETGDLIVEAGGQPVRTWQDLVAIIERSAGEEVELRVMRAERLLPLVVVPAEETVQEAGASPRKVGRIGIAPAIPRDRPGPLAAVGWGAQETWSWVSMTVGFVVDLFSGNVSPRSVGGPILIGQFSGRVARAGLETFLRFMAIFSINLAVLNLLPIPVLDGGHLVFLAVEAIRGRALSLEQRMRLTQVGLVIVVAIMVWAIANDVLRLFGL